MTEKPSLKKYPSRGDLDAILKAFGEFLRNGAIVDRAAFNLVLGRMVGADFYGPLPGELGALDQMTIEVREAEVTGEEVRVNVAELQKEATKKRKKLAKRMGEFEKLQAELQEHPLEEIDERSRIAIDEFHRRRRPAEEQLQMLKDALERAEDEYGLSSEEYEAAVERLQNFEEYMKRPDYMKYVAEPVAQFRHDYGFIRRTMEAKRQQAEELADEARSLKEQIGMIEAQLEKAQQKGEEATKLSKAEQRHNFYDLWAEAFRSLAATMRWPPVMVEAYGDPANVNEQTFEKDVMGALKTYYASDMIRDAAEERRERFDRQGEKVRETQQAKELLAPPLLAAQQDRIDGLLDEAEAVVKDFENLPSYTLTTGVDFGRRRARFVKPGEPKRARTMPRLGYFEMMLRAPVLATAYDDYITRLMPLDDARRNEMQDALIALLRVLEKHREHVRGVNWIMQTIMYDITPISHIDSVGIDAMVDIIKVSISQLTMEEPDIDNYVRNNIDEKVPGYYPGDAETARCLYYNPFSIAPVYYIFGVAGSSHKAVDKTHLWLHLTNGECEDMDCIPCALSVKSPFIVEVPEAQVAEVRAKIGSMTSGELSDDLAAYKTILKPVTAPWVIIKNVTQLGGWMIISSSAPELMPLLPSDAKAKLKEIVMLHVSGGHMTRVTGFEDYDGAGWSYDLECFAVVAKVGLCTGTGNALLKLLRGNQHLLDYGEYCLGPTTYDTLLAAKQANPNLNVLQQLTTRAMVATLVHDSLQMAEEDGTLLGPGEINGKKYDHVPITKLSEEQCVTDALAEWDELDNGHHLKDDSYKLRDMLHVPRWIVVSNLDKEKETWHVDCASEAMLVGITPLEAVARLDSLLVFVKRQNKDGSKTSPTLYRMIDCFIKVPAEGGSTDNYNGRCNLVVMCNSGGIMDTIRAHIPKNEDGDDLIGSEELDNAEREDTIEKQLACFKTVRYVLINGVRTSGDGRIKDFDAVCSQGKVTANELMFTDSEVLKLWLDPNKQVWLIVDSRWYNIEKAMRGLYDAVPTIYIGADYETLNRLSDTKEALISWASVDGATNEQGTGYWKGPDATRKFIAMVADLVIHQHRRVHIVTFHGAFFDLHMMLEGLATWGNFGQLDKDRIVIVGNKILEIDWLKQVKFIDLRRFTMQSLAVVSESFHVATPKSKIDLKLVQSVYERCNCNMESFWIDLSKMTSADLTRDVAKDSQQPDFQKLIEGMNGEKAYIEYCIRDSVATVQCYMELKKAVESALDTMGISEELRPQFEQAYNLDNFCTAPSLAYKAYRAGLPLGSDGKKVKPPVAKTLRIHTQMKASGIGGRSEIFDFVEPKIVTELHQIYDAISLFPFCAMAGHMPAGELHAVGDSRYGPLEKDTAEAKLPVSDKLGFYLCTITSQPPCPVIPCKEEGSSLDWKRHEPFTRWVHVVMIRLHIYLGGTIEVQRGYYWEEMEDHYFDNSLRLWKMVKMRQDYLKSLVPVISDDDATVNMPKFEALLDAKDASVKWALNPDGTRNQEAIDKILLEYCPMIRWLMKMLSNSLLGRTAKKLKECDVTLLTGHTKIEKFIEKHRSDHFVIHQLSKSKGNPSIMTQLDAPDDRCVMAVLETAQEDLFTQISSKKDSIKVPEACISVTMLAYAHFHMAISMNRFYAARAVRGIETDAVHGNPAWYTEWCEANGIANPFWIDSPLAHVAPGSVLDDAIFRPSSDPNSVKEMGILGAFRCLKAANRYGKVHGMPVIQEKDDYGFFKEELSNLGLYDVFYPFPKFYYVKCLETGKETIKGKGISASESSPSKNGHAYILLENSPEYLALGAEIALMPGGNKLKTMQQMKMLQACMNDSRRVMTRDLFEKVGQGIGIDAVDYRFQGRLSKINAIRVHVNDLGDGVVAMADGTQTKATPIHYTLCTKRIEPHRAYRVTVDKREKGQPLVVRRAGIELPAAMVEKLKLAVQCTYEARDPIMMRGFTEPIDGQVCYVSNDSMHKILAYIKEVNNTSHGVPAVLPVTLSASLPGPVGDMADPGRPSDPSPLVVDLSGTSCPVCGPSADGSDETS